MSARFLTTKLRLKVNASKSAVARPWERKFLGFSLTNGAAPKRAIAPKALQRFRERVREQTRRNRGINLERMIADLAPYLQGWRAYFGFSQLPSVLRDLDSWVRRRLRNVVWHQWRTGQRRFAELRARNVSRDLVAVSPQRTVLHLQLVASPKALSELFCICSWLLGPKDIRRG